MLLGEFLCSTDRQDQMCVPRPFYPELAAGLTLTRGIERCLLVLPSHAWQELTAKVQERLPFTDRDARAFARLIYASALACAPDEHRSIPLPSALRRYADIQDEAVWVGMGTHVEIWSPQHWQQTRARIDESGESVAQRLVPYGV